APPRPSSTLPRSSIPAAVDPARLREELERQRARGAELESEIRTLRTQSAELQEAVRRGTARDQQLQKLQRELDEARARAASGRSAGAARELLDLREQLHRKDKELLDLRDQLTRRDKELLSVKDGVLALEREKADLLDRVAELERQHAEIARTNEALRDDKEAAVKRADDWKRKAERHKRSEEHTSELQSRENLVCRLLLEK